MLNGKGHKSITSAVWLEVLSRASVGAAQRPELDQVLCSACEFVAPARSHVLIGHIDDDAVSQAREAGAALFGIRLAETADALQRGGLIALTERALKVWLLSRACASLLPPCAR